VSSGQKTRTLQHFPDMNYRAGRRIARRWSGPNPQLPAYYRAAGVENFRASEILRRLAEAPIRNRLAATPCDVGARTDNPYWRIVRQMPVGRFPLFDPWPVDSLDLLGSQSDDAPRPVRDGLVRQYAFAIPSPSDLAWCRQILGGRAVLEIGAGTGYWAWQLRQLGIDVLAIDNGDWSWPMQWTRVDDSNTAMAVLKNPDRALMMIWPPYSDSMASAVLDFYTGDLLIYAGEERYGCTADDEFHEALETRWEEISTAPHHPTFEGIHCRLRAYRRRPVTP
jgi:hypothetical protein